MSDDMKAWYQSRTVWGALIAIAASLANAAGVEVTSGDGAELADLIVAATGTAGGLVALQTLWVGPWLSRVCGWTPKQAAQGLFALNVTMLLTFLSWGVLVPRLTARGWTAQALIARGAPLSLIVIVAAIAAGPHSTAWVWALFCVTSTVVALAQPAVGQDFPSHLAGRALSAYNLVIFLGVFALQWMLGVVIDRLEASGWTTQAAFQGAFALLAAGCIGAYAWFLGFDDSPANDG